MVPITSKENDKRGEDKEEKKTPKRQSMFPFMITHDGLAAHEKEVNEFIDQCKAEVNKSKILENYRINATNFWIKYKVLCMRWIGKYTTISGDSRGKNFANEILKDIVSNPIVVAAVDDNLNVFKEVEQKFSNNIQPNVWLEVSCLTGAKSIFTYVQQQYKVNITNLTDAIPYAISSGNRELALEATKLAITQGQKELARAYLYVFENAKLAQEVQTTFDSMAKSPSI